MANGKPPKTDKMKHGHKQASNRACRRNRSCEDVETAQDGVPEENTDTEEDDGSEQELVKGTKEAKYRKQRNEARSALRNVRTELENLKASQAGSAAVIEELR
jgi:hypothetical protein